MSPARSIEGIRNHKSDVNIFCESSIISAIIAPEPTEWREIFHPKLTTVTNNDNKVVENMYDLKKAGIGNL